MTSPQHDRQFFPESSQLMVFTSSSLVITPSLVLDTWIEKKAQITPTRSIYLLTNIVGLANFKQKYFDYIEGKTTRYMDRRCSIMGKDVSWYYFDKIGAVEPEPVYEVSAPAATARYFYGLNTYSAILLQKLNFLEAFLNFFASGGKISMII